MNRPINAAPFVLLLSLFGCGGGSGAVTVSSAAEAGGEEAVPSSETQAAACWTPLTPDREGAHRVALAHAETFFPGRTEPLPFTERLVLQDKGFYQFELEGEARTIVVIRNENGWDVREAGIEEEEEHFLAAYPSARAWLPEEFAVVDVEVYRSTEDRVVIELKFTEAARPWHTFQTTVDLERQDGTWTLHESRDSNAEDSFQRLRNMAAALERMGLSFHGFGRRGDSGGTSLGDLEFSSVRAVDCAGNFVERIVTKAADGEIALLPVSAEGFRAAILEARTTAINNFQREYPEGIQFRTQTLGAMRVYSRGTDGALSAGTIRINRAAGTNPTFEEDWNVELVPVDGRSSALVRALDQLVINEGSAIEGFNGEQRSEDLWVDPMQDGQVLQTMVRYRANNRLLCRSVEARLQEGAPSDRAESWTLSFTSESRCEARLVGTR